MGPELEDSQLGASIRIWLHIVLVVLILGLEIQKAKHDDDSRNANQVRVSIHITGWSSQGLPPSA